MQRCPQQPDDDIQLMLRVKRGNRQAFNELYRKYNGIGRAFLAKFGCPEGLLDDLTQEVFTRLWESRKRYRPDSTVKTFLLGIAVNVRREQRRRDRSAKHFRLNQSPALTPGQSSPLSPVEFEQHRQETITDVKEALVKLPTKMQEAVRLIYIVEISAIEAAKLTSCSVETFQRRFERGVRRLRELLESLYDGE